LAPLWAQPGPENGPQTRTTAPSSRTTPPLREAPRTRPPQGSVPTWLQSVPVATDTTVEDAQDTVDLLKAQLEGKKAELQEAEALLQQAQARLNWTEKMIKSHTVSTSGRDAARTEVTVKEARVRVKQAQIKEGEIRLRQAMRHLTALRRSAPPAPSVPARDVAPQPAVGNADSSGLRTLVLQLETAITWDAVNSDWRTRRDGWVKEVTEASTVPALAKLIEELEMAVLWSAVTPNWAERRPGWIQDVSQASTVGQLAKLLGELEMYITWDAVTPDWKDFRDNWVTAVAQCKAL
ncbi:MAG TPA: hypothetical protein VFA18_05830, partial [Gemmataceae bacterium]|nr:hypothetical protein [Gemmataceae bacterium]